MIISSRKPKKYSVVKLPHGYFGGGIYEASLCPTIDTGVDQWHILIGESMEDIKCDQIGMLCGDKWERMHENIRRVYSPESISPTITASCGGHHEVKIAVLLV